jgi:RNA polymerase sigma-70 factor (ECF subfamily)
MLFCSDDKTNFAEKSDQELVALTLKDNKHYAYLIERYEEKLIRYIIRISHLSKEDAEDILQEVFVKVYQNLNDYDPDIKFSSWIYRITHNETISYLRKMNVRPKMVYFDANPAILNSLKQDSDIARDTEQKYSDEELLKLIDKLDKKYKIVLILKYFEEKNYREISDIIKRPIGTVATLLDRARKQFKKIYVANSR